jgi:hypothetical protein
MPVYAKNRKGSSPVRLPVKQLLLGLAVTLGLLALLYSVVVAQEVSFR